VDYRRFILPLLSVCVLGFVSAGCVQPEKPGHSSADELPFGEVVEPKPDQAISGPFTIRGWALSENGIQQVSIYEDRKFLANARLGLISVEAEKEYPNFPGNATAGWGFDADPTIFTSGPHELTVQARSKTGAVRDLASWKIVIGTPFGKMDEPVNGRRIGEPFAIHGWTISEHGVDQIAIYVDGKFFANPRYPIERKDVKTNFPTARDSLNSGYIYEATPAMFTPGEHLIEVRVQSKGGAVREIGKAKVTIQRN
jgi:hypothetical protein